MLAHGSVGSVSASAFGTLPEAADLRRLAEETGTPAFVLFEQRLRDNHALLRRALAPAEPVRLYYSVKSNFESDVLATVCDLGCGAEISGGVERLAVERAGFDWGRVVFDGPLKSEEDLAHAVEAGVHLVNVESEAEIERLRTLARRAGTRVRIGVRVDPAVRPPLYDLVIRTYRGKFGFPLDAVLPLAAPLARAEELQWAGLMAHVGSQVRSAAPYLNALDQLADAAARLRAHGIHIDELNVGGGLPADSMVNVRVSRRVRLTRLGDRLGLLRAPAASSTEIAARLAEHAAALRRRHDAAWALALEPGRMLVADAAVLLGRVRVVKPPWVFVDVSLNDLPEKLSLSEWRVAFPGRDGGVPVRRGHIAGPTLATQDVLFYDHPLPDVREGDLIAVFDTGAYSISRANQFTRPRPPVYFIDRHGALRLIRRAETPADVLRTQVAAPPAR